MKRLLVVATVTLLGACRAVAPTPDGFPADPAVASETTDAPDGEFAFRMTFHRDEEPEHRFTRYPTPVLTTSGLLIGIDTERMPSLEFPGPILRPLAAVGVPESVFEQLVEIARVRGLLDGDGAFLPEGPASGEIQGLVEFRIGDIVHSIRGYPNARITCVTTPCEPDPGSVEAFGAFWRESIEALHAASIDGPPMVPWRPRGYAMLIGPERDESRGMPVETIPWPLDTSLAATGTPISEEAVAPRCAMFYGDDALRLGPILRASTVLTRWTDGETGTAPVNFLVRPLMPGDGDVCANLFEAD